MQEPFGYFKAEPFGWTDCAETDEGAIALYERPAQRTWVGLNLSDREKLRDRFEGWGYPAILVDAVSDILKEKNT